MTEKALTAVSKVLKASRIEQWVAAGVDGTTIHAALLEQNDKSFLNRRHMHLKASSWSAILIRLGRSPWRAEYV